MHPLALLTAACVVLGADGTPRAETPTGKLYASRRCGECHGRQRDEWSKSPHALAASGAYARVAEPLPAAERAKCAGCHEPLRSAGPRVSGDGVGCDACHTAVDGGVDAVVLAPELATRFGPYRDSKDHHFHRVAYSAFVTSDALCIACHEGGGGVYTTATEWREVNGRKRCAACHMPAFKAIAAKGEKERSVAHHDFGALTKGGLAAAVKLKVEPARGAVTVELSNTGAHHALPTGRPENALRLDVELYDAAGKSLETASRRLERSMANGTDSRLKPGRAFKEAFKAPANAARAAVRLWYEPFARGEPELVTQTEQPLGSAGGR